MKKFIIKDFYIAILECIVIVGLALVPLFFSFPYRVNIFLSWEGAFRLYKGQIPFRDFGLPMGFAFWVIPAIFFKIFGPYLITLVKAQVLINIISGFSFRSIVKVFNVRPGLRFMCVLVFCMSYSFFNFWPWYDQSVIVFELVALSFILKFIFESKVRVRNVYLLIGCFFLFVSFFTKQDGGGLAFAICFLLVLYHSIVERKIKYILFFTGIYLLFALAIISPFIPHNFFYWFNYGQPYQNSRLSFFDILSVFLEQSKWIKFYIFIIIFIGLSKFREVKLLTENKKDVIFFLVTIGILAEASIFQVTSYTPPDNNIFFHSFAFAYIVSNLDVFRDINFSRVRIFILSSCLILVWWSSSYWKYIDRIVKREFHIQEKVDPNEVSIRTYMDSPNSSDSLDTNSDMSTWVGSDVNGFQKIYMPKSTAEGMDRLLELPLVKQKGAELKVLNMTELTPLAYAIGYKLETGHDIPLWYHKGVGMFQKQVDEYCNKIAGRYYDLVLFEDIPILNNFYPFEVQAYLKKYYREIDSFSGPRRGQYSRIEVFVRPE